MSAPLTLWLAVTPSSRGVGRTLDAAACAALEHADDDVLLGESPACAVVSFPNAGQAYPFLAGLFGEEAADRAADEGLVPGPRVACVRLN